MQYPASELVVDPVLIRQYDLSGPRYASYPTVDRFIEAFGDTQLRQWLAKRNIGGISQPLSVYVHLPSFPAADDHKAAAREHPRAAKYVRYLAKELDLLAPLLGRDRDICQLHWGGGAPAFLSRPEMSQLAAALGECFRPGWGTDRSVDVDPRSTPEGTMEFLAGLGFNRFSATVQDFDAGAQGEQAMRRAIEEARASGFRSVNIDLVYGAPKQTLDSFSRTLDKVVALGPDRIALYNHAHLPPAFIAQRRLPKAVMPSPEKALQMATLAIGQLARAGYLYIGMDHFARPGDDLAVAQRHGVLQCNFQGYSTHPESDILGLGAAAIGRVGPTYYQNLRPLHEYYAALDAGRLPVARGKELDHDDLVRRAAIQALACHFRLSIESIELAYLIDFPRYFAAELRELKRLAEDGLVELAPDWIVVTPRGRLLVRAICTVFDRHLRAGRERASRAKVI